MRNSRNYNNYPKSPVKVKNDVYEIDFIKGEYHYCSCGPSWHTWNDWKERVSENRKVFGQFNSPQAARKEFMCQHPIQDNYYYWGSTAARLFKNGKPIMAVGNGSLMK